MAPTGPSHDNDQPKPVEGQELPLDGEPVVTAASASVEVPASEGVEAPSGGAVLAAALRAVPEGTWLNEFGEGGPLSVDQYWLEGTFLRRFGNLIHILDLEVIKEEDRPKCHLPIQWAVRRNPNPDGAASPKILNSRREVLEVLSAAGIEVINQNRNCLEGMSCPDCGQNSAFDLEVEGVLEGDRSGSLTRATVEMTDDGFCEPLFRSDTGWTGPCECAQCGCAGTVGDFRFDPKASVAPADSPAVDLPGDLYASVCLPDLEDEDELSMLILESLQSVGRIPAVLDEDGDPVDPDRDYGVTWSSKHVCEVFRKGAVGTHPETGEVVDERELVARVTVAYEPGSAQVVVGPKPAM